MRTPKKATELIKEVLGRYTYNEEETSFDILHLYDTGKFGITNNGYIDSRFFDIHAFNTETLCYRIFEWHDAISFMHETPEDVRIFADGSFMITFTEFIKIDDTQDVYLKSSI